MNFKILVLSVLALAISGSNMAQTKGAIDSKTLNEIRNSFNANASTKAIQNAITNSKSIRDIALNRSKVGVTDHFFKYRVAVKGITNQKSSGRCWMFTSMNTIRPNVIKDLNLNSFDFSHNYN